MTEVAVVILNFNGQKFLKQFLPAVIQHSTGADIFVADNGSTDGSADFIHANFPQVGLIQIKENKGFCGGYNAALKQIEAIYYVLLNSDVEVTANWIAPIIRLFKADPAIGAIQPKILSYRNKTEFEYAGAGGGWLDSLGYPFCRGRIFNSLEKDTGQYDDVSQIFWATGACHFVRSELYRQLSGLDEDYFAHMEEIDFCWRLQRAGYKIYYQGESTVYHVGGGTLSAVSPRKTYLNFRNGLSLIFKHLPMQQLIWKLPLRLILDWTAAVKFLFQPSRRDALAVLKAHLHFLSSLPNESRKRKKLAEAFNNYSVEQLYPRFLVVDYFLLGNKSFKKLRF